MNKSELVHFIYELSTWSFILPIMILRWYLTVSWREKSMSNQQESKGKRRKGTCPGLLKTIQTQGENTRKRKKKSKKSSAIKIHRDAVNLLNV